MTTLPTLLRGALFGTLTMATAMACGAPPEEPPSSLGDEPVEEEPPPGIVGAIQLVEMRMPAMQMGMASASARFLYFDPAWLNDQDAAVDEEPCRVFLEDASEPPADPADAELPPKPRDVGAIAVQGGRVDVFLEFRGAQYDAAMPEGVLDLFDAGDTLLALGAGNDDTGAGEFEVEVVAPADLVVTAPADASSLTASEDLVVSWEPGTSESEIQIVLQSQSGDMQRTGAMVCEADDATGSFTVPADLLAQLPTGDARLEVDRIARGFRRDGPVATNLYAISASMWGTALTP